MSVGLRLGKVEGSEDGLLDGSDERLGEKLGRKFDVGRLDTVGDEVEGLDEGADDGSTLGNVDGFVLASSEGLTDGYITIEMLMVSLWNHKNIRDHISIHIKNLPDLMVPCLVGRRENC